MPRVRRALRVALGAAHDRVDIPVTGADPEPHQVKLCGGGGAHGGAVIRVVAGDEHVGGVDRHRDLAAGGALTQGAQLLASASNTSTGCTSSGRYRTPSPSTYSSPMAAAPAEATIPLMRNAVTFRRCQTARSSRTTIATLVSNSATVIRRIIARGGAPSVLNDVALFGPLAKLHARSPYRRRWAMSANMDGQTAHAPPRGGVCAQFGRAAAPPTPQRPTGTPGVLGPWRGLRLPG